MSIDLRLAVTDLPVGSLPVHIKCPDGVHAQRLAGKHDRTSSLCVYPDNIHCYGCGLHLNLWQGPGPAPEGDIHPLTVLLGIHDDEARKVESYYSSEALDAYRERVEVETAAEPLHPSLADIYHEVLTRGPRKHRLEWLHDRGLSDQTIKRAQIGHDGQRFTIPVYDAEGKLVTFRYRRDDEYCDDKYPKYCGMVKRNGFFLYPLHLRPEYTEEMYLCEGEFDALLLRQLGYAALSATNGAGQVHKIPALLKEMMPGVTHLIIATDQDEAGEEAARLTLLAATELGFTAERLTWTAGKDVSDAHRLGTLSLG